MELKTRGCHSYVYEKMFQVEPLKTFTPVESNSKILINDIINLLRNNISIKIGNIQSLPLLFSNNIMIIQINK